MKYLRIVLIVLSAGLCACPCVTELPTDNKITEPVDYSSIAVINCIRQSGRLKVSDKYEDTLAFADYNNNSVVYVKAAAEIENFLKITSPASGRVLYYSPVILRDREKLSFIPYGDTLHTYALLLNDSITSYSPSNVYIRFVNVMPDAGKFTFRGAAGYPVETQLAYGQYSAIQTAYSGKHGIDILDSAGIAVCSLKDYSFRPGYLYILIYRPGNKNDAPAECLPVELKQD